MQNRSLGVLHLRWRLWLLAVSASLAVLAADPSKEPYTIRISCGSFDDVRTAPTNTLWYRDFGYTGGRFANATRPSFIIPPLKTLRHFPLSDGPENCYYINNVPNGHYQVRLFFALVADPNLDSEPIFDVSVEGTLFSSLLLGWSSEDEKTFAEALVFVQDSSLSICFHSTGHGDPSILSIEVLQIDDNAYKFGPSWGKGTVLRTAKRLTCGSGKPAFDEDLNGIHWGGDRFWLGVKTLSSSSDDQPLSTENVIAETLLAPNFYPQSIYQSAIVGTDRQPSLSFEMDVTPNRNYSVWLHFAEIENGITAEQERVFDVLINGDTAFKDIDIIRMAGERFTALVLNKTIVVTGTTLTIVLQPVKGTRAIISAIEVFEIILAEKKTLTQEVGALRTLKGSLGLPLRLGWNGDPCVPQQHPWGGVECQFDDTKGHWVIDGLGLDNQGLRGVIPGDISKLQHLQSINLSGNSIKGNIPVTLGTISGLQVLDLSYNELNGSIPDSLGQLASLLILNLNGNDLSGRVPASLGGRPLHRARFNFTDNAGLCGIPGLHECGPHLSVAAKIGMAFGVLVAILFLVVFAACWWKRRQNIRRAQKLAAAREAPYAKSRTQFTRDMQMAKHHRPHESSRSGNDESTPHLLPS
ncbi:receptor-like protein 4 [Oryza brachyantha]|uniref:Malectin-like domain-containing protein n=1 Tax=Oryza brachyantha TaxID=4533 RepID=J3ML48_ORYBR|nr:receptor-like protein 4 [Oryza brachyantha]